MSLARGGPIYDENGNFIYYQTFKNQTILKGCRVALVLTKPLDGFPDNACTLGQGSF